MGKAFETNEYRNLFAEYGYDETEIQNRMKNIWETIFFGSDEDKFYFEVGDDMGGGMQLIQGTMMFVLKVNLSSSNG